MSALEADDARIHAAMIGWDFDNQTDYCEPCRGYHIGEEHDEVVQPQCGSVGIWGDGVATDCVREVGHSGRLRDSHCDIDGTSWFG